MKRSKTPPGISPMLRQAIEPPPAKPLPRPVRKGPRPQSAPAPSPAPTPVRPLFRKIDWLTLGIAFAVVWTVYLFTLAPEVTLEDSGELVTGAYYAGVPHPPGYPVWTIYSWLWTELLPIGNIAWRVEVGESMALALACGLVAFMVSRGSSLLIESIAELRTVPAKWEQVFCVVSGTVAGLMLGFGGVMWSESVAINRISPFGVPWMMVVLLCLLRWIYAPQQRRYLYFAMFFFGICATIHQTLLVAAVGLEAAIAAAQPRLGRDLFLGNSVVFVIGLILRSHDAVPLLKVPMVFAIFCCVGLGSMAAWIWLGLKTKALGTEWKAVLLMGLLWLAGASFYFYEPIACMTNSPMQWGYPRTVEGFFRALGRGQYGGAPNPTDIIHDPGRFLMQMGLLVDGVVEEYSWVLVGVALLPVLFFRKLQSRERSWIIGLAGTYLCIGVLLMILMNPSADRSGAELVKVFFISSRAIVAILIGYGLTLIAACMATQYERFRRWGYRGGAVAAALALFGLWEATGKHYFGPAGRVGFFELPRWIGQAFARDQFGLPIYAHLILAAVPLVFLFGLKACRSRPPLAMTLGLFLALPVYSGFSHWFQSEQRNHWFGYWFGHDMFTPPFAGPDGKLSYDAGLRERAMKENNGALVYPEMTRKAILYGGTDPGRFCPTYMIFCESFTPRRCQPEADQNFDRRDVYIITQNALAEGPYLDYIRAHYNRSTQHDPLFFQELLRSRREREENYSTNFVARAAGALLDRPFTALGAKVEARRRSEGVYPAKEIYLPPNDELQGFFAEYVADAQRRLAHDQQFPNEPRQIKPGEEVKIEGNRVQVAGPVAVFGINGLVAKRIFERNPDHEFFLEESMPIDWMYPHLTPFGIIMKINRQPVPEITEEMVRRDHEFWSRYSERLIGNWITYDTNVQEIVDFVERVHLRHDFSGFKGDRKFLGDDSAQKSFCKLRSSIAASVYQWRIHDPNNRNPAVQLRMLKEADFAWRQAFAFCPFSPDVIAHYVNLLLWQGRVDDAVLITQTYLKFDPNNDQVRGWLDNLRRLKQQRA